MNKIQAIGFCQKRYIFYYSHDTINADGGCDSAVKRFGGIYPGALNGERFLLKQTQK